MGVGHAVFTATNGREGLTKVLSIHPDLIVIDVFMPEQDGLETIRILNQQFPHIAILAMSGRCVNSSPMLTVALELGAANVLEKPFDALTVRAAVEATLETQAHRKPAEVIVNQSAGPIPPESE